MMRKMAGMAPATNHFARRVPATSTLSSRAAFRRAFTRDEIRARAAATLPPLPWRIRAAEARVLTSSLWVRRAMASSASCRGVP